MRQHCAIFIIAHIRKICVSKLQGTLKFKSLDAKQGTKHPPSCRLAGVFNTDLRQNLEF